MLIIVKHWINKPTARQNKLLVKKLFAMKYPDIVYEKLC